MSAQLHQSRVEVDLVASALQHCAAKVVVQNHARLAATSRQRHARGRAGSSPSSGRRRTPDTAPATTTAWPRSRTTCDAARPTVTWPKWAQSTWACSAGNACSLRKGSRAVRAQPGHGAPQLHDAAGVTAVADHLVNACGAQPRMPVQSLTYELHIRVRDRGPHWLSTIEAVRFDGVAHGIGMNVEFSGNSADFPVLGVKVTANLHARFRADHEFLLPHRGYRGKGSTNRPFRPHTTQRRKGTGGLSGRLRCLTAALEPDGSVTGCVSGVPHPHDGGEEIEREP